MVLFGPSHLTLQEPILQTDPGTHRQTVCYGSVAGRLLNVQATFCWSAMRTCMAASEGVQRGFLHVGGGAEGRAYMYGEKGRSHTLCEEGAPIYTNGANGVHPHIEGEGVRPYEVKGTRDVGKVVPMCR